MTNPGGMIRDEANKKGHPGRVPSRWLSGCCLRQVIAEAGPEHVVYAFGADSVGVGGNRRARPALAQGISVLHAQAHPAIVAPIEVVPVAGGGFLDVFGLGAAASAGVEASGAPVVTRSGIGEAGGVAEVVRAVADWRDSWRSPVAAPYFGRGILCCRGRAECSADPGVAAGVVPTVVQVDSEAGSGGNLYRTQGREVVQGGELTASRSGNVGERAGAIAAHTRSVEALETHGEPLGERNATAGAQAADGDAVVVTAGRGKRRGNRGSADDILQAAVEVAVGGFAGINGLVGVTSDAEDFIVAKAGIKGRFDDDVRHGVEGVVGDVSAGVDRLVDRQIGVDAAIRFVGVVHDAGRGRAGAYGGVVVSTVRTGAAQDGIGSVAGQRRGIEQLGVLGCDAEGCMLHGL